MRNYHHTLLQFSWLFCEYGTKIKIEYPKYLTWEKTNFRGLNYLYQIRAKSCDHVWPDPYLPIKDYLPILLRGIYKEIGENIGKTCSAVHFRLIIGWNNFSKRIIIFLPNSYFHKGPINFERTFWCLQIMWPLKVS